MSDLVPKVFHGTINEIVAGEMDPTELPAGTLADLCRALNRAYRAGEPFVTDAQYDELFIGALSQTDPDNEFLGAVEPEEDAFDAPTARHASPMLSTDKAYTSEEIEAFFRRVEKVASRFNSLEPSVLSFRVTAKLDGIAGHDDGERLVTRGDGLRGSDITYVIERGFEMVGGRGLGAGELVIDQSYFENVLQPRFPKLKHPRNYITGFAGAHTVKDHHRAAAQAGALRFVPYSELPNWTVSADDFMASREEIITSLRDECPYLTDGVVVELVGPDWLKDELGSTSHHHRWQVAVKEKGETRDATVTDIRLQTGRTGRITPVLEIDPVELEGATISNVTAHTAATLIRKGLGAGAVIRISRGGGVIPTLEEVVTPSDEPMHVSECPSCGSATEVEGEYVVCPNTAECPSQTENRLRHWFKTLANADLFGPVTVKTLVSAGYRELPDIYALDEDDFAALGFGPGQSKNLVEQLERSRREAIPDWRFLAAFGIRHLGRGDSRKLLENYPLAEVITLTAEQIEAVSGFGPVTSPQIAKSFQQLRGLIEQMLELGFNLEPTPRAGGESSPLSGLSVVFTGAMQSGSRDEMKEQARSLGVNVQSSVNGKTDLLVTGDRVGAKKLRAAQKFADEGQLKIISEQDWLGLAED